MSSVTTQIIEFLSHPELPFGTEEDVLLLEDPAALRDRAAKLLDENPNVLGPEETAELKTHLDEVAWSFVALELQTRIDAASSFFDDDANARNAPSNNGLA